VRGDGDCVAIIPNIQKLESGSSSSGSQATSHQATCMSVENDAKRNLLDSTVEHVEHTNLATEGDGRDSLMSHALENNGDDNEIESEEEEGLDDEEEPRPSSSPRMAPPPLLFKTGDTVITSSKKYKVKLDNERAIVRHVSRNNCKVQMQEGELKGDIKDFKPLNLKPAPPHPPAPQRGTLVSSWRDLDNMR
jgi:hypothetical protein